jgi:hypothetical protein
LRRKTFKSNWMKRGKHAGKIAVELARVGPLSQATDDLCATRCSVTAGPVWMLRAEAGVTPGATPL